MKNPAVLLYTDSFLSGCSTLDFEERGKYITLLCMQHQIGHLSEKSIKLSVGYISDDLKAKFKTDENGLLYNERMDIEINKRNSFVESRSNNGKCGGKPTNIKASGKPSVLPSDKPSVISYANTSGKLVININKDIINNINRDINEVNNIINYCINYFNEKYITVNSIIPILKSNYSESQIINAIKFGREDSFWCQNFLSPAKLLSKDKNKVLYIDIFLAKCKNETVKTIESIDENKEYQYWIQDLRRDFIPHYGNRKKIMIDKSFYENQGFEVKLPKEWENEKH